MEVNYAILGIGISYGVNFLLLYTRKQSWNTDQFRWTLSGLLFVIGIVGLFEIVNEIDKNFQFFSWCLITPFMYNILDRTFQRITKRKYKRDFYLWLRGSFEIDDSLFGKNPHVRTLDKLFSLLLLFAIIFLPLIGM